MLPEATSRGPEFEDQRHAAPLPVKELRAGRLAFALVHFGADIRRDFVGGFQDLARSSSLR